MQLSQIIGFAALVGAGIADAAAVVSYADGYEPTAGEHAQNLARAAEPVGLEARAGSATGCVQAHCYFVASNIDNDVIIYEIYQNGEYLFQLNGGSRSMGELQWNGLTDYKGRKWGFKSNGQCTSMSYINNFQSKYDYYPLTRTDLQSSPRDCDPCTESKSGKQKCSKCAQKEAIFSDGPSGQCYGYNGLSRCDFRSYCGRVNGNVRLCGTNNQCRSG
ncbi:uncharacterized protein CTRU02_202982 [Colletotrichum truncatum]|uniref:Uncharacterized protein n=1 Tax=Colletotrichum truncatum TaxID=5467 RepID=A0ACC3Z821_COLTU|nr:uncharacterized protein CTRU02_13195 [Colletotrichum truncatum]KAF6783687.1 hypothetical protein CTRU02_13195 [Colletotrichum truncatum]